jgi:hypothetical protein
VYGYHPTYEPSHNKYTLWLEEKNNSLSTCRCKLIEVDLKSHLEQQHQCVTPSHLNRLAQDRHEHTKKMKNRNTRRGDRGGYLNGFDICRGGSRIQVLRTWIHSRTPRCSLAALSLGPSSLPPPPSPPPSPLPQSQSPQRTLASVRSSRRREIELPSSSHRPPLPGAPLPWMRSQIRLERLLQASIGSSGEVGGR